MVSGISALFLITACKSRIIAKISIKKANIYESWCYLFSREQYHSKPYYWSVFRAESWVDSLHWEFKYKAELFGLINLGKPVLDKGKIIGKEKRTIVTKGWGWCGVEFKEIWENLRGLI